MRDPILFGPPAATLGLLLDDPAEHDFASAERLLAGLSGEQATTVPPGLPYSVAAVVAHVNANVRFNLGLIRSADPARCGHPDELWPSVSSADWPELVGELLAGLADLSRAARSEDLDRVLYPATDEEPAWTVGYKLAVSVAKHNAYHFGQIAVLRRLIGAPA